MIAVMAGHKKPIFHHEGLAFLVLESIFFGVQV